MGNFCARKRPKSVEAQVSYDEENPKIADANQRSSESEEKQPNSKLPFDPKDLMMTKLQNELVVRQPGKIQGQQCIIDDCKGCDIFILDNSAAITIDDVQDSRLFVGPCETSLFFRNCKNCNLVVACQQLRLRDCENMDILLYVSAGQPIIESSNNIRFGCFQYSYFGLRKQFEAANLPLWNSEWSNVHDFTQKSNETHWSFLDDSVKVSDMLKPLSMISEEFTNEEKLQCVVPLTHGRRPIAQQEVCFVLLLPENFDYGFDLLQSLNELLQSHALYLIRTRESLLNNQQMKEMLQSRPNLAPFAKKGRVVGMEFNGANSNEVVAKAALPLMQQNLMFVSTASNGRSLVNKFFEDLKVAV